jgi:hypothetical protein
MQSLCLKKPERVDIFNKSTLSEQQQAAFARIATQELASLKNCLGDSLLAFEIINEKFNYVEAVFNQGELHKLGLDTLKQIIASLLPVPY